MLASDFLDPEFTGKIASWDSLDEDVHFLCIGGEARLEASINPTSELESLANEPAWCGILFVVFRSPQGSTPLYFLLRRHSSLTATRETFPWTDWCCRVVPLSRKLTAYRRSARLSRRVVQSANTTGVVAQTPHHKHLQTSRLAALLPGNLQALLKRTEFIWENINSVRKLPVKTFETASSGSKMQISLLLSACELVQFQPITGWDIARGTFKRGWNRGRGGEARKQTMLNTQPFCQAKPSATIQVFWHCANFLNFRGS